jgi:hypothetical protein
LLLGSLDHLKAFDVASEALVGVPKKNTRSDRKHHRLWNTSQSRRSRRAFAFDGILRNHPVIAFSKMNKKDPRKAWAD